MKEIKFRGWDKEDKEMIFFDLEKLAYGKNYLWWKNILPGLEIMQYTGLKGKNGVEIYEDDIVEDYGYKGVIKYRSDKYGCAFFIDRTEFGTGGFGHVEKHMEVIGNIHQHPNLLEKL